MLALVERRAESQISEKEEADLVRMVGRDADSRRGSASEVDYSARGAVFALSTDNIVGAAECAAWSSPQWSSPQSSRPQASAKLAFQARILRDIFGNPFRPVVFSPSWRTSTAVALASQMYESRDFSAMPILADALQDAGCDSADVLDHCRGPGPHVRGCWVVDLVLEKE